MCSLVSREERLRRRPVGCWELLQVAEVLLVTPHVEQTGSGLSVARKALAGPSQADCDAQPRYAARRAKSATTTGRKHSVSTGRLTSSLEPVLKLIQAI